MSTNRLNDLGQPASRAKPGLETERPSTSGETAAVARFPRPPAWVAGSVLLYLVLAFVLARVTWLHSHDDAYITYVFARSLAAGEGLTWNGSPGLGTTSPLLAVALGTLEKLVPVGVPVWGHLLAWAALFATACLVLQLGRHEGWPAAGFLAGLGWLASPAAVDFLGGEYPIAVAFVAAAAAACAWRRPLALAVTLAVAVGLRSEMAIAAVLLALGVVARDGWSRGLRWLVPGAAGALALWGGWLSVLYRLAGTALPGTLAAKRAQAESPFPFWHGGEKFLLKAWNQAGFFYPAGKGLFLAAAALGLLSLALLWLRRQPSGARGPAARGPAARGPAARGPAARGPATRPVLVAVLALWGWLHTAALAALDIPYYPWYTVPLHFSLLLLVGLAAELPRRLPVRLRSGATALGALALAVLLAVNGGRNLRRHAGRVEDVREVVYRGLSEWISTAYPPATRVASFEVGYLGYYGRFETVDLLGLTTPETPLDAVRRGDFPQVVRVLRPDLLVLPLPFVELGRALVGDPRSFLAGFELDHVHQERRWPPVLIYRRRDLAGRGEVVADLLAAARGAPGAAIEFRFKKRSGAPALVLPPGESRRVPVAAGPGLELFLLFAADREPPAVARARLLDGQRETAADGRTQPEGTWLQWAMPVAGDGAATLELRCEAQSRSACLFAVPHLRRTAAGPRNGP